jgi:putative membrane protein
MKRVLSAVCCIALGTMPALAMKGAADHAPMTDQQFVNFAAQTDMVEANLGQRAQDVAASQKVKDYGQMLVTDHTKDFGELHMAAQKAGLDVPSAIDAEHNKKMIDPFQKLTGKAFDTKYAATMVQGHTQALALYKKEEADAQNAAIRTYAEDAIPVLEKHLRDAKDLEK